MGIRVIICDRHKDFLDSVRVLLQSHDDIDVVAALESYNKVVEKAQGFQPDVIVFDVGWSIKADMETLRMFIREVPNVKVLALGMDASEMVMTYVLESGAAGYIRKDRTFEELAPAILAVAAGRDPIDVCSQTTDHEKSYRGVRHF